MFFVKWKVLLFYEWRYKGKKFKEQYRLINDLMNCNFTFFQGKTISDHLPL